MEAKAAPASQAVGEPETRDSTQENGGSTNGTANGLADASLKTVAATIEPVEFRFLNRELTWLAFNRRVFAEAEDERNPLLERVKFLAITASNLDEFFMKRIGGLKQQVVAGVHELTVDGRTPQQQIEECLREVRAFRPRSARFLPALLQALADATESGIVAYRPLTSGEQALLRE